jgi:hypothetical protein
MDKLGIISFINKNAAGELRFRMPVVIQLSPQDIGLKVYGLIVMNYDLIINHDGGSTEWSCASEPVRKSIVESLKLISEEMNIAISN